jgi:hypothetical protein
MLTARTQLAAALMLLALATARSTSQEPTSDRLRPANGSVKYDFKNVTAARALRDGTVLLSDPPNGAVIIADFTNGSAKPLTGLPRGSLYALPGDSSLQVQLGCCWAVFDGSRPLGTLDRTTPAVAIAEQVAGADSLGHVLTTHADPSPRDSMSASLVDRATGSHKAIAMLLYQPPEGRRVPYYMWETTALALDGWVVVLRMDPYRVDWRTPSGSWVRGAPIPFGKVAVDEKEKRAFLVRTARGGKPSEASAWTWPDSVPPWVISPSLQFTPDGKVIVQRTQTADHPGLRYDLIDRTGVRERQIELPVNERIVGFGAGAVYVAVMRIDGTTAEVARHPWP